MKKLLSIMLGLTLVIGAATVSFAAQEEKKEEGKKKKGKKKKGGDEKQPF
jgi:Spy/CpxP family protein refolding chaperone